MIAQLAQHVVAGLAAGSIIALVAVAILVVWRSTHVLNVAQGELATLSAFVCFALMQHGWAFWPAFGATIVLSFIGGTLLEFILVRAALRDADPAPLVLLVGLFLVVDGLDTWIWGETPRRVAGPFSSGRVHALGTSFPTRELGTIGIAVAALAVAVAVLARARIGLGLRAIAAHPFEARLAGVRLPGLAAVAFGFAAGLGAIAGVLASTSASQPATLEPGLMRTTIFYGLAAVAIGGMTSPLAVALCALALGLVLELASAYVHWVGGDLRPAAALALVLAALALRPLLRSGRWAPAS